MIFRLLCVSGLVEICVSHFDLDSKYEGRSLVDDHPHKDMMILKVHLNPKASILIALDGEMSTILIRDVSMIEQYVMNDKDFLRLVLTDQKLKNIEYAEAAIRIPLI